MFKYVIYTKVETEHTVLEFRGGNDTIKLKHYDVPVVSIEADNEAEIDDLIAQQSIEIKCAVLTKNAFVALVKNTKQFQRELYHINEEFDNSVNTLIDGIPTNERLSWDKQETEARNYLIDKSSVTPLIDSLLTARGVEKDYLVSKIIEKADLYASSVGVLVGKRQKQEDELLK